jgi:hypothetical protein
VDGGLPPSSHPLIKKNAKSRLGKMTFLIKKMKKGHEDKARFFSMPFLIELSMNLVTM